MLNVYILYLGLVKVKALEGVLFNYIVQHRLKSSNIAYMRTFVYLPLILNYWLSLSLRPLSHKDLHHPYHPYILPIHIKNVLRAGSVGRPLWVSALAGGLQASGAQKVSWILRNCVMFLVYFLTATLSNCQLNYCKMVAQVLRIMYFLLKSILLYLYIVYFVQLYVSIGAKVNKQCVHIIIFFPLFSPR